MHNSKMFTLFSFLILFFSVCNALSNCSYPLKVIDVNQSGNEGSFKTVQSAIDSIPDPNTQWTHIQIAAGIYTETVSIKISKPCIFLEGAGSDLTIIQASEHETMISSATFASSADDITVKGITFKNTYNIPFVEQDTNIAPALAANIEGDRTAFYNCSFNGLQDTLLDNKGRHYFQYCYIQGAVDFIFGDGQSIYEKCIINFTTGAMGHDGTITAQNRETSDSPTGFVFKNCSISGTNGRAQLGRAYGPYSRVIIAYSYLSDVVRPEGWSNWDQPTNDITYVESNNNGPGADTSQRVTWMKHWSAEEINTFLDISYINQEGWIEKQPTANNL